MITKEVLKNNLNEFKKNSHIYSFCQTKAFYSKAKFSGL